MFALAARFQQAPQKPFSHTPRNCVSANKCLFDKLTGLSAKAFHAYGERKIPPIHQKETPRRNLVKNRDGLYGQTPSSDPKLHRLMKAYLRLHAAFTQNDPGSSEARCDADQINADHHFLVDWLYAEKALENVYKLDDGAPFTACHEYVKKTCLPCLKRYDLDTEEAYRKAERIVRSHQKWDFSLLGYIEEILADSDFQADPRSYMQRWDEPDLFAHSQAAFSFFKSFGPVKYVNLHSQVAGLADLLECAGDPIRVKIIQGAAQWDASDRFMDVVVEAQMNWQSRFNGLQKLRSNADDPDVIAIENVNDMVSKAMKILGANKILK